MQINFFTVLSFKNKFKSIFPVNKKICGNLQICMDMYIQYTIYPPVYR